MTILKQLGFLVHVDKCIGCSSCRFSCYNEYGHCDIFRRTVHDITEKRDILNYSYHHVSISCNHCGNPACLASCPKAAIQKKTNGVVIIDKSKCDGCGKCEAACPFQAIHIDPMSGKADKCDMCYDRLLQGQPTVCVSSCPVQAIEIIDLYDSKNSHYEKEMYGFEMKKITNPSIRFTNSEKQAKQFWAKE